MKVSEYSVYDYFYEKPSVLLTFVTLVISLMSFLFNSLIVSYRNQLLSYWGLEQYSTKSVTVGFSIFSILFVLGLLFFLCNYIVTSSSDAFIYNTFFFIGFMKEINETKTMIHNALKQLCDMKDNAEDKDNKKRNKNEMEEGLKREEAIKQRLVKLYTSTSVIEYTKSLIVSIIVMWSSFVLMIKTLPIYIEFKSFALGFLFFTLMYHLLIMLIEICFLLLFQKGDLRKQLNNERNDDYADAFAKFPSVMLRNFRFRELFKNSNIRAFTRTCSIILFLVFGFFVLLTEVGISQQKDFGIIDVDGNKVALISRNDDICYGNRIKIIDDIAYISKTEHVIIKMNNSSYTSRSFSEVIRVESLDDVIKPVDSISEAVCEDLPTSSAGNNT